MESVCFQVPAIGTSYFMCIAKIKFSINLCNFYFSNHHADQTMGCSLYYKVPHHKKIISFLEKYPHHSLLFQKRLEKRKYILSFHKNDENLYLFVKILKKVFSSSTVDLKVFLTNNQYTLPICSFHLLDLYEMGYMSYQPVVFPLHSVFTKYETSIFTGICLIANRPFHKYSYDYLELDLSNMFQNQDLFLDISFDMMLQDRPELFSYMTVLITSLLSDIPFRENNKSHSHLQKWKRNHELEIYHYEIDKMDWKPSLIIKPLSRILDIFPSYSVHLKYSLNLSM